MQRAMSRTSWYPRTRRTTMRFDVFLRRPRPILVLVDGRKNAKIPHPNVHLSALLSVLPSVLPPPAHEIHHRCMGYGVPLYSIPRQNGGPGEAKPLETICCGPRPARRTFRRLLQRETWKGLPPFSMLDRRLIQSP